jgi:hypothetical protein
MGGGSSSPIASDQPLALITFGDSVTLGCCGQAAGSDWPHQVGDLWTASSLTVYNEAIDAQRSGSIAVRMNAYAGQIQQTVASSFIIPTSGSVNITFRAGYNPCYQAGVQGPMSGALQLTFSLNGTDYAGTCVDGGPTNEGSFKPSSYPGSPVPVASGSAFTAVMLDGSNNPIEITSSSCVSIQSTIIPNVPQYEADVTAMVNKVSAITPCWSVMTILNSELSSQWISGSFYINQILPLNTWILQTFGTHAVDIRQNLLDFYNPANTLDAQDHTNGIIPATLRSATHPGSKLSSPISDTSTCAFTTSVTFYTAGGNVAQIDNEYILVSGGSNGNFICTRGYAGSTPATHSTGTAVNEIDWLHPGVNGLTSENSNCEGHGGYRCMADQYVSWMTTAIARPTKTALMASATSVAIGSPVTLKATVTGNSPTGEVNFSAGNATLGTATLSGGVATLQASFSAAGSYTVTAAYVGDSSNAASTSGAVNIQVLQSASTTALQASTTTANQNQQIVLTATVTGFNPTGTVTFGAGNNALGTASLANGTAQLTTQFANAGTYKVTANYGGDGNNQQSASGSIAITVIAPGYKPSSTPPSQTIKAGQSATFTITVTPSGGFSSAVNFACDGLPSGASCSFSPSSVTPNGGPASTTLTISTTAPTAALERRKSPWMPEGGLAFAGVLGQLFGRRRLWKRARTTFSAVLFIAAAILAAGGCGGGGSNSGGGGTPGTPAGTYTVTVNASVTGGTSQPTTLTLTVN